MSISITQLPIPMLTNIITFAPDSLAIVCLIQSNVIMYRDDMLRQQMIKSIERTCAPLEIETVSDACRWINAMRSGPCSLDEWSVALQTPDRLWQDQELRELLIHNIRNDKIYVVLHQFFEQQSHVQSDTIRHVLRFMLADKSESVIKLQALDLICRNKEWTTTVQHFVMSHNTLNETVQALIHAGTVAGMELCSCTLL